ncbi:hypothetical protein H5395_17015 [Paracoccus sp. MC1854]|uniref:hypothetical protein n=1 Tax=Paracoccus sp. MC1854 TaxID=2760306 RepID=UPI001602D065|nr:hypothetical protein [Paracoccus sp. MC1854]MBB1493166.1 hypothetical protein [Paracoccus sp. MC1854]
MKRGQDQAGDRISGFIPNCTTISALLQGSATEHPPLQSAVRVSRNSADRLAACKSRKRHGKPYRSSDLLALE